jgi:hypothetical protein
VANELEIKCIMHSSDKAFTGTIKAFDNGSMGARN